jgi:hypothetical protein
MNAKEVTERLHKHGYYDHKDAGDGNGLPVYKWYTYDGILVASDTSKAKAAHEAYKHYLAPIQQITPQAPAPVDILREKNERIAALEKALSQLRDTMLKGVSGYELSDMIKLINAALEAPRKLQIEPIDAMGDGGEALQSSAPLAPEASSEVTLSESEIEWLAEHEIAFGVQRGKFCVPFTGAIQTWTFTTRIVERTYIHTSEENQYDEWYVLKPEFDKRENRAAIASRRKELGLA